MPIEGEREAEHHRDERLEGGLRTHRDEAGKGEEIDGEIFGRGEFQSEIRNPAGKQRDHHHAGERPEAGRHEGKGQRPARLAGLGHRIAVEGGGDGGRFARDVEEDRGRRAAEQRPPIHAGEQDDRRDRIHREGQRQEQGHPVRRAEAGQHADQDAERHAYHHQQDMVPA
ncbi:hypothetical protein ABIA27_000909 [Sinorhizobium fredii]